MKKNTVEDWFRANYLDGDEVQDGQMLSSKECLDALTTHHQELQKARAEMLHKLHLCAIGKYEGDALENVKAQIAEYQSELDQPISQDNK